MKTSNHHTRILFTTLVIFATAIMTLASTHSMAQDNAPYMRIAKITIDAASLDEYTRALKEQMQSALKLEAGVLAYAAVQDKKNPAKITILETYASVAAYEAHIQTEHFKKYKTTTADMVLELELTDVVPIAVQSKQH